MLAKDQNKKNDQKRMTDSPVLDLNNSDIIRVGNKKFRDFVNTLIDVDSPSVKDLLGEERFDIDNEEFSIFSTWLYYYFSSLNSSELDEAIKMYKSNYLQLKMFSGYNILLNDYLNLLVFL